MTYSFAGIERAIGDAAKRAGHWAAIQRLGPAGGWDFAVFGACGALGVARLTCCELMMNGVMHHPDESAPTPQESYALSTLLDEKVRDIEEARERGTR